MIQGLNLQIIPHGFLQPAEYPVGAGHVQQRSGVRYRALQSHALCLSNGLSRHSQCIFFLTGLPVVPQKLVQQLKQAAVVPFLNCLSRRLLHEVFRFLAFVLLKVPIHLLQNFLHIQHINPALFPFFESQAETRFIVPSYSLT